ncbi:MAG: dihydrofolate reductase family protein [Pseudonocardiaceae bacterium]
MDEYRIMIFPVILGGGKRMFPSVMLNPARLTITSNQTVGSGVVILTLVPHGGVAK